MRTHNKPTELTELTESPQLTETEVNILDLFKENEQPATSDNELEDMLHMLHNINELNALEMSIVQDEEELLQSQWIDVSALATQLEGQQSEQISVVPTAIPTTIQSYINLQPQITPLVEYQEQPVDDKLKSLTEDIGICKCDQCNCSRTENCQGSTSSTHVVVEEKEDGVKLCNGGCLNNNCKCNDQLESYFSNGNCCIMVCLKTIEQLRQMLNLANKCVTNPLPLNITSLSSSCCQQLIQTIPLTPSQFHA